MMRNLQTLERSDVAMRKKGVNGDGFQRPADPAAAAKLEDASADAKTRRMSESNTIDSLLKIAGDSRAGIPPI
jgi:hypothetical protein